MSLSAWAAILFPSGLPAPRSAFHVTAAAPGEVADVFASQARLPFFPDGEDQIGLFLADPISIFEEFLFRGAQRELGRGPARESVAKVGPLDGPTDGHCARPL